MEAQTICRRPGLGMACSFSIVICLVVFGPFASLAQTVEEVALRHLVERFFAAYQNRDLDALLLLWSDKSANLAAAKASFQRTFDASSLDVKSLTFHKIRVVGGKATVQIVVEIDSVEAKTGSGASGFVKVSRTLDCIKEGELWKVCRYVPSEEDLADALISKRTLGEREALLAAEKEQVNSSLVQALLEKARVLFGQGGYSGGLDVAELAADAAKRIGDMGLHATALRIIGAIHHAKGSFALALARYEQSLTIAEELQDKPQIASGLNNIGLTQAALGNFAMSLAYFQRAVRIREEIGDKLGLAETLNNMGLSEAQQGNYREALQYYQRSLELKEASGNTARFATTLHNIAAAHSAQGHYVQALEYYQKSLSIKESLGNRGSIASTLSAIGNVYIRQRNYSQALEYFEKSLKLSEVTGDQPGIAGILMSMGIVSSQQGDYDRALQYYQRSLKFNREAGRKSSVGRILGNMGSLYSSMGDAGKALESYQDSLKIAEEIGNKNEISFALIGIAMLYLKQSRYAEVVEVADRAATLARQIGSSQLMLDSHIVAGEAYHHLGQAQRAREAFSEAILASEEFRAQIVGDEQQQQQFFDHQLSPYNKMAELLIDQNNFVDALTYVESGKGRTLLNVLRNGRIEISKAMTPDEREEEHKVVGELNSLNAQITRERAQEHPDKTRIADLAVRLHKARLDQERFQVNLFAAHPGLKVRRGNMQPVTLEQAGLLIPDKDTVLVEYVVAAKKTLLFVLTNGARVKSEQRASAPILKVYTLNTDERDLASLIEKFRGRLANQDFLFHEPARKLYDLLLGPAREELQDKTNLIIVPDGILWELPFQALQPAPKRFLIENCAVSYAPSITVLLEMTRSRAVANSSPTLLALGNPAIGQRTIAKMSSVSMSERLEPLPQAERQVKELAKLYGAGRSRIYVGSGAQEAIVKTEANGYGILHLAAHGILNDKNPMYSAVVLSQAEGDRNEDGVLEAWEIMKLDLKADLVVLSACDTARGKVGNGEGMIGLAWAFFVAGVPTTVASQWSVDAASTTELMIEFHCNLERHKSKAESLRQAMLKLLRSNEYSRPFYWAGFVVVGNGR